MFLLVSVFCFLFVLFLFLSERNDTEVILPRATFYAETQTSLKTILSHRFSPGELSLRPKMLSHQALIPKENQSWIKPV